MTNALANMEKPRDVDRETRKLFRTISVSVEGSLVPQGAPADLTGLTAFRLLKK